MNIDMIDIEESGPQFSNNNSYLVLSNAPVESLLQMAIDKGSSGFNVFVRRINQQQFTNMNLVDIQAEIR